MTMALLDGALVLAAGRLATAGVKHPYSQAEQLAEFVIGQSPPLSRLEAEYWKVVERREAREPLERITGVAHFRNLEISIGPEVFVPRPETLTVVEAALTWLKEQGDTTPVVIDLCTGSGVIAMAIASGFPAATVHAVEISAAACEWARRNVDGYGVTVHCAAAVDALAGQQQVASLIVANPPYIPVGGTIADPEVRDWDPATALWAGADGLDVIRQVESAAARLLKPGGVVMVEHGQTQGGPVRKLFEQNRIWHDIDVFPTVEDNYLVATRA
jgi:release factor glutamine methyltransferase